MKKVYQRLAELSAQKANCEASNNTEWLEYANVHIERLLAFAPSGSGIDTGTKFEGYKNGNLYFNLSFHHINSNGFYSGWTDHTITARPDLLYNINLKISGRNENDIKDYLFYTYYSWLTSEVDEHDNIIFE